MAYTLDHTMMRVEDDEESIDWYETHLDYEVKGTMEGESFTNYYLGPEDVHDEGAVLELTHNHGDNTYEMGDGWGHVAVRVEDVEEAYSELMDGGVEDYRPPEENPGYAFVTDPDGHEIEIVERDHGARWSLDHTMIRVEDATEALGYWARTFEYEPAGRWEADSFANYFAKPQGAAEEAMSMELTYNYDGRSYDLGDAWGHVAVRVDDLDEAWEEMLVRDSEDYRDPESCDHQYAFTKDPDGHEIELIEK